MWNGLWFLVSDLGMKKRFFFAFGLLACTAAYSQSPSGYNIVDLGNGLGTNSYAHAINSQGQVVGYQIVSNCTRGFVYSNGVFTDIGSLGSTNQYALTINSTGQVAGFGDTTNGTRAFIFSSGSLTNLGPFWGIGSYAYGINDSGTIVGFVAQTNASIGLVYSSAGVTNLGTLGGSNSFGFAVNSANVVVGSSLDTNQSLKAFSWSGIQLANLNDLLSPGSGWVLQEARAINDNGEIVGWGTTNGCEQGYLFDGNQITGVGLLPGATNSYALAVNNLSQVVGASTLSNGITKAVLWDNCSLININDLLPLGSGWDLREARGINDAGQIVGWGITNGQVHAFVLNPSTNSTNSAVAPSITSEPVALSAFAGSTVSFTVGAAGTAPLVFQWQKDGTNLCDGPEITGATSPRLTLNGIAATDQGDYRVVVRNAAGGVMSDEAALWVGTTDRLGYWRFNDASFTAVVPLRL